MNARDFAGPFAFYQHAIMGDGFVSDWLRCGLFDARMDREYDAVPPEEEDTLLSAGGEGRIVPFEGLTVSWQGRQITWERWHGGDIRASVFDEQLAKEWFPKWGYAATYLRSPEAREVLFWVMGGDLHTLWLNHGLLSKSSKRVVYKAHLKEGMNLVLIRVRRDRGTPSFSFRVTGEEEKGVPDISIWLRTSE